MIRLPIIQCFHTLPKSLSLVTRSLPRSLPRSTIAPYYTLKYSNFIRFNHATNDRPKLPPVKPVEVKHSFKPSQPTQVEEKPLGKKILQENIYTVPNFLTTSRIITTPIITYFIITHQTNHAMVLFTISCITDFLDGFIARRFKLSTILGTILDPIADKLLMGCCTIALLISGSMNPILGGLFIVKDSMLALMGVYYRYTTLPPPKTWKRLANLSIPTVKIEPNMISKVNTGLQMIYIGSLVYFDILNGVSGFNQGLEAFEYIVGGTTLISAFSYIFSKKSIKAL